MAVFRIITFLIKAITGAIASLLAAVFTHVIPALVAGLAVIALIFALCTTCGLGSLAFWRKQRNNQQD